QRTSRMICDVFKHSPVFRIGGDEFVVVLTDCDYNDRNQLLEKIRGESESNRKSCSGPVVASGMAVYEPESDKSFCDVFERADREMYENKSLLKSRKAMEDFRKIDALDKVIPPERKRMLDRLFGALCTVADEGYIYLNDMRYDYSRWSLPLVDDFKLNSEYMYHADRIWKNYIHPDDLKVYEDAVDAVLCGNVELKKIFYRARKADGTYVLLTTRGFVLCDKDGKPEYFGGVMVVQ
ncbi:MAG: PAS domain-containing protein, partial [Treponema sp.]|nr:PAS domain-containing protein [Treponema sp.]